MFSKFHSYVKFRESYEIHNIHKYSVLVKCTISEMSKLIAENTGESAIGLREKHICFYYHDLSCNGYIFNHVL